MLASGIISIVLKLTFVGAFLFAPDTGVFPDWFEYPFVVLITTIIWLAATFLNQSASKDVLYNLLGGYSQVGQVGPK